METSTILCVFTYKQIKRILETRITKVQNAFVYLFILIILKSL